MNQQLGLTQIKRLAQYKDRWTSYGANTGIIELSEKPTVKVLRAIDIFKDYDETFLEKISQDISIARWKKDTVLFEEGSYIDVAFFIVSGSVDMSLQQQERLPSQDTPIFDASRTVMRGVMELRKQEEQQAGGQTVFQSQVSQQQSSKTQISFLSTMDFDLAPGTSIRLGAGELFGEIGALSGWPQSVTARTATECEFVQIRLPALRLMRRRSAALKDRLDKLYRERALSSQLKATPLFSACSEDFLQQLANKVQLVSCEPDEIITNEGAEADALYLVRSGFVKLSQAMGEGQIVVSYLSKGSTLGEAELLIEGLSGWLYTASSQANSELVKVSRKDFEDLLKQYPAVERLLWSSVIARTKEAGYSKKNIRQSEFISTALDKGLVEGNSILMIDLNTCTRCDDCVRGCASTHGGIPRFVREGDKYENFLITRACYHCRDPLCLVGCPTGAIRRAKVGDVVEIDPKLCIGCSTCYNNCPYDAITMYETGEVWPKDMIPEGLRGKERQLATKCDLCYTDPAGPACVRSCPNGCAYRVGSIEEFRNLIR
ncbi:MAG TPA: cyclic nucleotide-binding domain-containing protein [Bacteroidota bacterium]